MISSLKNNKKKVLLTASIAVILIAALVVVMTLTKPYAVYADGTKVENPYAVKAGGEELFLVKDSKTAEKVIETVMDKYSPGKHRSTPSQLTRSCPARKLILREAESRKPL